LPLEQISSTGTALFYLHDQLGSTRLLTNTSGAIQASYTYDAYGNLLGKTGSLTNPFGYAGRYADSESALIYLRARYYDPATAQFVSRDPLRASVNLYGYVHQDPLNRFDPTGLLDFFVFGSIAAGIPLPGWSPSGEGVAVVGYSDAIGLYLGLIVAGGQEVGTEQNFGAQYTGTEYIASTGSGFMQEQINIQELQVGPEVPELGGAGVGAGKYQTSCGETGGFLYSDIEVFHQELSIGIGGSLPASPPPPLGVPIIPVPPPSSTPAPATGTPVPQPLPAP
jgi:RHS repeat-associated protein